MYFRWYEIELKNYIVLLGFLGGSLVKNLPTNAGDRRHWFSLWIWKIPWKRKWQPISVFSPGKSHGQRSLVAAVHGIAKSLTWLSDWAWAHVINNCAISFIVFVDEKQPKKEKNFVWVILRIIIWEQHFRKL